MSVQVQEVDGIATNGKAIQQPLPEASPLTLEQIRQQLGALLVPKVLPNGYFLAQSLLVADRNVNLVFRSVNLVFRSKEEVLAGGGNPKPVLYIRLVKSANLKAKTGFLKPVSINGHEGLLITGGWVQPGPDQIRWDPNICTILAFQQDGWTVTITGVELSRETKFWDEDSLIKIAVGLGKE